MSEYHVELQRLRQAAMEAVGNDGAYVDEVYHLLVLELENQRQRHAESAEIERRELLQEIRTTTSEANRWCERAKRAEARLESLSGKR